MKSPTNNDLTQALPIDTLVGKCQKGDIKAFQEIYQVYKERIFNIAYRIHGNRQDAEDSVQDAFVLLYRKIGSFKGESAFSTWFYRIVVNSCLSNIRKEKKRQQEYQTDFAGEINQCLLKQVESEGSIQLILEEELNHLPVGYRTVFTLYEIEGFKHEEIAEILGISVGTSKSQLHRAKAILQKRLKPYLEYLK